MNKEWSMSKIDPASITADNNFAFYYETVSSQMLVRFDRAQYEKLLPAIERAYIFSKDSCYHVRKRGGKLFAVVTRKGAGERPLSTVDVKNTTGIAGAAVEKTGGRYEARIPRIGERIEKNFTPDIYVRIFNFEGVESGCSMPFLA